MKGTTLIFGPGWLGSQFHERVPDSVLTRADIADEAQVHAALDEAKPARVVNCAGKTGTPNVDACERDPAGTYRSNVAGPIVLAGACQARGIHFTHLGSGCIYRGDNGGPGFSEGDAPNFFGNLYARTKVVAEAALRDLEALQLRIRMPLSATPGPRNLLTKLLGYPSVYVAPNSVTVLEDLWPAALALIERGETGVWNLVNEGVQTHDRLLALYRDLVDPTFEVRVASQDAVAKRLAAGRSNCLLSTKKLRAAGLGMPHLDTSLPTLVKAYGRA